MHVLMIGLDNTMFTQEGRGDLPKRLLEYAKHVDFISLIIHTPAGDFKPLKIADNVMAYPTNSKHKWQFPRDALKIAKSIHAENPLSLVTTQDPFVCGHAGYKIKKSLKIPLIVNIYSSFFDDPFWKKENWKNPIFNIYGKWLVRRSDGVRVECDTEKDKVISLGVDPSKVKVAPVLVSLDRFAHEKDAGIRQKYPEAEKLVLFIGRLSVEKNVGLLIRAAKLLEDKLPKVKFLIVGGGAEEANLKALAGESKNIIFVGRVPHAEIPKWHRAADVFVLPSFYEGIPLVVVEAAAAGLPVICTEVRDAKDVIVEGKTGYIVSRDDPAMLADRIEKVLADSARAKAMGIEGQKLVMDKFDPKKNLDDCIALWRQVAQ